jgi:6-phosphogluconolactonase
LLLGGACPGRNPALSPYIRRSTLALLAILAFGLVVAGPAPAARFLYGSQPSANQVLGFSIDNATGAVTSLPAIGTGTATGPSGITISPDAKFLFVALASAGAVQTYSIQSDGALTPAGLAVPAGTAPTGLALSPDGKTLYVTDSSAHTLRAFGVSSAGGLNDLGQQDAGTSPTGVVVSPGNSNVYVLDAGASKVLKFPILTGGAVGAGSQAADTGAAPSSIAIASNGTSLFVTNQTDGSVSGYEVTSNGALTAHFGSPFSTGAAPRQVVVSPTPPYAFVANGPSQPLSVLSVTSPGVLSPVTGPNPFPASTALAVADSGKRLFGAVDGHLLLFDVPPSGFVAEESGSPVDLTGAAPSSLALTPNQPPTASFHVDELNQSGTLFNASTTTDIDGVPAAYSWDFGDGETGSGQITAHTYAAPGTYTVTVTVTDVDGCSTKRVFTGALLACNGSQAATTSQQLTFDPLNTGPPATPPCIHDGDDGFCGTPDLKAPLATVLGITNGSSITTLDAPEDIVGMVTPDPSGIKDVRLHFTKAAGTLVTKKTATKRVCRRLHGKKRCKRRPIYKKTCRRVKGKRRCTKRKIVKVTHTKIPMCLTVSGTKNYLVKLRCSKVRWITVPGDTTFRYSLPVALGVGSYSVEALASDGAGNSDVLEDGRNVVTFKVVNTPSNQDSGGGTSVGGGTTTTTDTPAIDDTGSPFGKG